MKFNKCRTIFFSLIILSTIIYINKRRQRLSYSTPQTNLPDQKTATTATTNG